MGKIISTINLILWLGFGILITSCRPIRSTRDSFQFTQYCYNGTPTGLDTKIDIDGYYTFSRTYIANIGYPSKPRVTTYQFNCLFLNDGTFIYYFSPETGGGLWGKYVVKNDTIMAKFIEAPGGMSWSSGEISFKIVDPNIIQWLYMTFQGNITDTLTRQYQSTKDKKNISLGKFVPNDNLPNPNKSWLMKREWFWCDKNQYKAWKKGLKD